MFSGAPQVGTDTDALAVKAAGRNASLNGLQDSFRVVQCEATAEVGRTATHQRIVSVVLMSMPSPASQASAMVHCVCVLIDEQRD